MRTSRLSVLRAVVLALLLSLLVAVPAGAAAKGADRQPVLTEFTPTGDPIPDPDEDIGWSQLVRRSNGMGATLHLEGLAPNGVYTVWMIAVQDGGAFPGEIFVAQGTGFVTKKNGKATVHVAADVGDAGIDGFYNPAGCGGVCEFDSFHDPLNSLVRFEIAYHGQAPATGVPPAWLTDFWTGDTSVCADPLGSLGTGLIPSQPHCPVFYAATHAP